MDEVWETLYGMPRYLSSFNGTVCFAHIVFVHPSHL